MAFDNRHISFIDLNIDRKCYRRNPHNSIIIPLYLTILHLCLGVVNGEGILKDGRGASPPAMILLPSETLGDSSFRLVKRLAQSNPDTVPANTGAQQEKKVTDVIKAAAGTTSSPILKGSGDLPVSSVEDSKKVVSRLTNETLLPRAENATTKVNVSKDADQSAVDSEGGELGHGPPNGLKPDAVLRLFYVFVGIGVIVLIYLLIKFLRFRRKRATRKYRVLAHSDEQEMFPLAADDGDDEEIFNAADHQTLK